MDPLPHPVQSHWWMSYSVLSTQIISFICVTTKEEPRFKCIYRMSCKLSERCLEMQNHQVFLGIVHSHWQIQFQQNFLCKKLHCTLRRLLTTAVARQEHPDRLWGSPNFLFGVYPGYVYGHEINCLCLLAVFRMCGPMLLLLIVCLWLGGSFSTGIPWRWWSCGM